MKRFARMARVKPDKVEFYKRIHAAVWPEVLELIRKGHIHNYSIFYRDGYLFSYLEYEERPGDDESSGIPLEQLKQKNKEWAALCLPCFERLETAKPGEIECPMEEVFHTD
jgi:L-rhamnose mutarotase